MLKLSDIAGVKSATYTFETESGETVSIPFTHKIITAQIQEEVSRHVLQAYAKIQKARKKAEKEEVISTDLPDNMTVVQLTMVLDSIDIEVAPGVRLDPTKYQEIIRLPASVIDGIHAMIFADVLVKKTTSTDSITTTSETDDEGLPLEG